MNKKTVGLLSGVLLITGGLILRNLYKKGKLKGVEDFLKPLLNYNKESKDEVTPSMHTVD